MKPVQIVAWLVVGIMAAAIIYGFTAGSFGDDASALWALPWGKVSLIDLYAGLIIFGAWVAFRETSLGRTVLWWIALATLGNLAAGAYLVIAALRAGDVTELMVGAKIDA